MINPARPAPGAVLCPLADIADGAAKGFVFRKDDALFMGFVLRQGGEVTGFIDCCPHNGMPLSALPDRYLTKDGRYILCSGHGALFQRDGECVSGPCEGEKLEAWAVKVAGEVVVTA